MPSATSTDDRRRVRLRAALATTALAASLFAAGCDHAEQEPNDTFVQGSIHPIVVSPGTWHGGRGTLPPGDEDWWRLDPTSGTVDVAYFGIPPGTAIEAHLYELQPTGVLVHGGSQALACPWDPVRDPKKRAWCTAAVRWTAPGWRYGATFVVLRNGIGSPFYGFIAE
jgi:hypothetical protein